MRTKGAAARDALPRLGKTVKRHRTQAVLTQEDVAYEAGVALRTYQNLETGRLNPGYLTLLAVARALSVRLGDLLNEVR